MKFFVRFSIYIFILNLFIFKTFAQTDTAKSNERIVLDYTNLKKNVEEKTKIVSASRFAISIDDLPVTTRVILRDEILRNNYITLVDVLKTVPGMRVSQPGNGDDGETFLMRGLLGNYYTKILINNLPMAPSVAGSLSIGAQLPIRQAERIEIIYGPASAVYGADATAGVINIITKQAENNTFTQADLVQGDGGYSYLNFMIGGKAGKNQHIIQYSLYGSKFNYRNMNIRQSKNGVYHRFNYILVEQQLNYLPAMLNVEKITDVTSEMLKNAGISEQLFFPHSTAGTIESPEMNDIPESSYLLGIQLKYKGFQFSFDETYRSQHSSIGRTTFLYNYNNPQNFAGQYLHRTTLNYAKEWNKLSMTTNLAYIHYRTDNRSSRGVLYYHDITDLYNYSASDDIFGEHYYAYKFRENLEFVAGGSFQYSGNLPNTNDLLTPFKTGLYKSFQKQALPEDSVFGSFGLNPITYYTYGIFAQAFWQWRKFNVIFGLRHDHNSEYGQALNPRFALLYKINKKLSVKTSAGSAFKAPAPNLTYYSNAFRSVKTDKIVYAFIPNNQLKPEIFKAGETALTYIINSKYVLDFTLYNNEIQNLISAIPVQIDTLEYPNAETSNLSTITRKYINSRGAKSTLSGIELSLKGRNLISSIKLNADISVNFAKGSEVLAMDSTVTIDDFRLLPEAMFQMRVSCYPFKNFYVDMENIAISKWYRGYIPTREYYESTNSQVNGYFTTDILCRYNISRNLSFYFKVINLFDTQYGGIDATRLDVDLQYNPQLRRVFRFGLNFVLE